MTLELDGINDYIDCGSGSSIGNIFDGGGSLALWTQQNTQAASQTFIDKRTDVTGWTWYNNDSESVYELFFNFSTTAGVWRIAEPSAGERHHVVVTYDADSVSNNPIVYLDGTSITVTETGTPVGTRVSDIARPLLLGVSNDSPISRPYDGLMEDVRLYDSIITTEQIAQLAAGYCDSIGGEVGWWKMRRATSGLPWNDGQILVQGVDLIPDDSGNGNNGDPFGSPIVRPHLISCRGRSKRHFLGMM